MAPIKCVRITTERHVNVDYTNRKMLLRFKCQISLHKATPTKFTVL